MNVKYRGRYTGLRRSEYASSVAIGTAIHGSATDSTGGRRRPRTSATDPATTRTANSIANHGAPTNHWYSATARGRCPSSGGIHATWTDSRRTSTTNGAATSAPAAAADVHPSQDRRASRSSRIVSRCAGTRVIRSTNNTIDTARPAAYSARSPPPAGAFSAGKENHGRAETAGAAVAASAASLTRPPT